jgi:hypothetical protein
MIINLKMNSGLKDCLMNKRICFALLLICTGEIIWGQTGISDSSNMIKLEEVLVTANRLPILLKNNPGAISLVTPEILSTISKSA